MSVTEDAHALVVRLSAELEDARCTAQANLLLLDQVPALVVLFREPSEPRIEFMNHLVVKLWEGRDQSGKTLSEIGTDPAFIETIRTAFLTGQPQTDRHLSLALDWDGDGIAEKRTFTVITQPIRNARGEVEKVMTLSLDVTDTVLAQQRATESERRFLELADAVPTIVFETDLQGRATFWNRLLAETTGLGPTPTMEEFLACVLPADRQALRTHLDACVNGDESSFDIELRLNCTRGRKWFLCHVRTRHDASGGRAGLIGSLTDIDGLKRAEARKDEFLAMLGHELRNPLAPIVTAAELLRTDERIGPEVEIIRRQANHLARLVDDLVDISRMTRGRIELRREHLQLNDVVHSAIETIRPSFEKTGHHLKLDLEAGIVVDADPIRLSQVVVNLLTNALRYSPAGSDIDVIVRATSSDVRLYVRDQGIGIAPSDLQQIFMLFVQVNPSLARKTGGLGVGLTLVQQLVQLHGGHVSARSAGLGQGAEFVVVLPRASDSPTSHCVSAPINPPPERCLEGVLVLVVDDNVDAADLLAALLQREGATVDVVYDGHAALEQLDQLRPTVALVDIGLPGLNGLQVAERASLTKTKKGQPILIATTGYDQSKDKEEALRAGFDGFFVKPLDHTQLIAFIRSRIG